MEPVDLSLLTMDPPDHTRLRGSPSRPSHHGVWRTTAGGRAGHRELLDAALARSGPFDLVAELASRCRSGSSRHCWTCPTSTAPGSPGGVWRWVLAGRRPLPAHVRELTRATEDLRTLFGELLEQRRAQPGEDVISTLAGAVDGGTATADEVLALAQLLLVAGLRDHHQPDRQRRAGDAPHPGQWAALVADPALASAAVEETLRYDPPVQLTARFAHEDVEIGDLRLRRDSGVLVLMASANRDPAVHPDPDRFDLHREQAAPHLAFSGGAHYCLGAPLARLEGEVALRLLAERAPRLRPAGDPVPRVATVLRGPLHLPVTA